jgi:hypothetical protein
MESLIFDPKENKIEKLKDNPPSYYSFHILLITISVAMFAILYKKSNIATIDLYDKYKRLLSLVFQKISSILFSMNQPIIKKNSIKMMRYSYELPNSIFYK